MQLGCRLAVHLPPSQRAGLACSRQPPALSSLVAQPAAAHLTGSQRTSRSGFFLSLPVPQDDNALQQMRFVFISAWAAPVGSPALIFCSTLNPFSPLLTVAQR